MNELRIETMIFILAAIWIFSRWRPINVQYFNESSNNNTDSTSSGGSKGLIIFKGKT